MIRRLVPRVEGRAPLVIGALFAVPAFMANLLVASLAVDRPHVVGKTEHAPTASTEAKVWLVALIAPAILLALGLAAIRLGRIGVYAVLAVAIAFCLALPSAAGAYTDDHARRFPLGMDHLVDSSPSNTSSHGEWEQAAHDSVTSMSHWTLALALAALIVTVAVQLRSRGTGQTATPAVVTGAAEASPVPAQGDGGDTS